MVKIETYSKDFRVKATLTAAIASLFMLLPFSINNFVQDRILLGVTSLIVVFLLLGSAYQAHRGSFYAGYNLAFFILTLGFLGLAIDRQGQIGLFWCYPVVPLFYCLLNEKPAWILNGSLLLLAGYYSPLILEFPLAIRLMASLMALSFFSAFFSRIIIVQQKRLADIEASRREGMAALSHELRTPIALLIAQSDAMLDGIRPIDRAQVSTLSGSLEHLSNLVEDMYQLALADVNALECKIEDMDLVEVVRASLIAAYSKLEDKNFVIVDHLPDQQWVQGDARRLRQVVDNLLENCCRYTQQNGVITLSMQLEKNSLKLIISDDGPGMDDKSLASVFDRFYRIDPSRNEETGGAGLGLSLVSMLVELNNGNVEAFHSAEGGFGVSIQLPLARRGKKNQNSVVG